MRATSQRFSFTLYSVMLAITLMMVTLTAHAASVQWQSFTPSIFKHAKESHKMVLLYGFSPTCPYCARMNSSTFTDKNVINAINRKYEAAKIDTTRNNATADKYGMNVIPAIVIMNSDGSVVNTIFGYHDPDELLGKL
jgi:thioredoxin-related protein